MIATGVTQDKFLEGVYIKGFSDTRIELSGTKDSSKNGLGERDVECLFILTISYLFKAYTNSLQ